MHKIVQIKFGSHLYGTATENSDLDLKSVYIPEAQDILLGRVRDVISTSTGDPNAKNTADDVDDECFSLQRFLKLASEGQTVAMDMLFAPDWAYIGEPSYLWRHITDNRAKLLTKQSKSFVGYVKSQAGRYGIRGSRVAASRAALRLLTISDTFGRSPLGDIAEEIGELCASHEHMQIVNIKSQAGTDVLHWEVCDRKMPFTASIKSAHDIMKRIVDNYGHRALAAEKNEGVDWKAISHAVRIAEQAIELLTTAHITFPRPNAAELLDIKLGRLEYKPIAERLDKLLAEVETAAEASLLPASVDQAWIDNFVLEVHRAKVATPKYLHL